MSSVNIPTIEPLRETRQRTFATSMWNSLLRPPDSTGAGLGWVKKTVRPGAPPAPRADTTGRAAIRRGAHTVPEGRRTVQSRPAARRGFDLPQHRPRGTGVLSNRQQT